MNLLIRIATEADLPAIVDIYNQSIPAGWSTADTRPIAVADRIDWFRKFDPARRPIWVAEADGQVVGTVYLSSFYHDRPAYRLEMELWEAAMTGKPTYPEWQWANPDVLRAGQAQGSLCCDLALKFRDE